MRGEHIDPNEFVTGPSEGVKAQGPALPPRRSLANSLTFDQPQATTPTPESAPAPVEAPKAPEAAPVSTPAPVDLEARKAALQTELDRLKVAHPSVTLDTQTPAPAPATKAPNLVDNFMGAPTRKPIQGAAGGESGAAAPPVPAGTASRIGAAGADVFGIQRPGRSSIVHQRDCPCGDWLSWRIGCHGSDYTMWERPRRSKAFCWRGLGVE